MSEIEDIEKYNLSLQEQKIKIDLYKTRRLTALEVPHSRGAIEIVSNGQVYTIEQRIPFPGKTVINELMLDKEYKIEECENNNFISGRVGKIIVNEREIGVIGEIAPRVLKNWKIGYPVPALELNLSSLM